MFARIDAKALSDLLKPLSQRGPARGVYFCRLSSGGQDTLSALWEYHEKARQRGVIIEGQIANPDERQIGYLTDVLGTAFEPTPQFVSAALEKWTPRMGPALRREFSQALCQQFAEMKRKGKTDSVLKNIYVKMLCWLYYRFERLFPFLGQDDPPGVLYETDNLTGHELILLRLLSSIGADILILESAGDQMYLKQDPSSQYSQLLNPNGEPLPQGFALKAFRKEMMAKARPAAPKPAAAPPVSRPAVPPRPAAPTAPRPQAAPAKPREIDPTKYFPAPARSACTNAWMKNPAYTEMLTPVISRGDDPNLFYNAYVRLSGVEDKLTYLNELYQFYQQLRAAHRNVVIVDQRLPQPSPEETQKIRRRNYRSAGELIVDLAGNLPSSAHVDLQRQMQRAFTEVMQRAAKEETNLNRLVVSAVYLLCWVNQYQAALFQGYKGNEIPVFILLGGCQSRHEALYISYLARLPVDVLILAPDLNQPCQLEDDALLKLQGALSMPVQKFPRDAGSLQMRTLASHAEADLTDLLYSDSGMYRTRQFSTGEAITLQTTYDEIFILWEQELKFRTNFSTNNQVVNMPVIYAKISGVENGKADAYWQKIKLLLNNKNNVFLLRDLPFQQPGEANGFQALALKGLKNGVLKRDVIKSNRQYPFALLREELQEHIFDKLQLMLDRRLIRGTYENGTEYTVVSTVLNMKKELLRLLQSFDFTRLNPKLVCVSTSERTASLEDAILFTFLNLVGFDIVLFVPTGYQIIENHLNDNYPVEHQAGDFMYDLRVPDFNALPMKGHSWLDNIWKRGK